MSIPEYDNLIGGQWVAAAGGERFVRHDPADTDHVVGAFPDMDAADAARAIEAAAGAAGAWSRAGLLARGRILLDAAAILRSRMDAVARDLTRENGKTLVEARGEVAASANFLEYFGGLARAPYGELLADAREGVRGWSVRAAVGTVLLITPWNDPLLTPARKAAPALLAGNSVVIKPASHTPLGTWHLARALHKAGLPAGAFNIVTGRPSRLRDALTRDPRIAAISFTGSTAV